MKKNTVKKYCLSENTVVVEPDDGAVVSRTLNRQHVIKCNVQQCVDRKFSDSDSSDNSETMLIPRRTKRLTAGEHHGFQCILYHPHIVLD
jgi:hypothetical protein